MSDTHLSVKSEAAATPLDHISVCVCTYKRPELLKRLLEQLAHQETRTLFTYSIVVADNDASQSAKAIVSAHSAVFNIPTTYCAQPRRNIALTRNMAVDNAHGDFIAFIDDDEVPAERWLLNLYQICRKYNVAGVLGPVLPSFDIDTPNWVVKGRFYDRPRYPTGVFLDWEKCRTGNVLLRSKIFAEEGNRFNPEFLAGSDQEFFKRMIRQGHFFIWCDEAIVHEIVPSARCKRSFMVRRALFRGVFSFYNRRSSLSAIALSLVATPAYTVALPFIILFSHARFMRYLFSLCYHLGRLLGLLGVNPIKEPYVTE